MVTANRFIITDTPLSGLKLIERQCMGDSRGFFSRIFCANELTAAGWTKPIAQINQTFTAKAGTIRGMDFQRPPHAEMKLVSCLQGDVFDVAIDLRSDSPTFLQWHGVRLSAGNLCALLIPEGFAHGFQTLTDDVELLYCHSAPYVPSTEAGLYPLDPRLAIAWPLPVTELSTRDGQHPLINETFEGMSPK
jgi:dTDP-4-dehydrorhamnose 3,5-epimerase